MSLPISPLDAAAGFTYETLISDKYKLLVEPNEYKYDAFTAMEAAILYGNLKYLSEVIFTAAHAKDDIVEKPTVKV